LSLYSFNISLVFHNLIFDSILDCFFQQNPIEFHDLSKTTTKIDSNKTWRFLSSKLDILCGNLTLIKFLKDPSTRGNSPNFQNQKMKMKPILLSIKPVNGSSLNSNFSNRVNLVNSIGICPVKEIKNISTRLNLFFQKNLKIC